MRNGLFANKGMVFALLVSMSTCAWATDDLLTEQAFLQDLPVVLSASRLLQPVSEAPNAMTVIDRETIKASGLRSIPDLFKLVPGMYVSYYNGNQAIVSYHGTTDQRARRMQVLVDGRSVYLSPEGGVDWEDIPLQLEDIERIEVIRGPAAASYGGNSTQGVISITTSDASGPQKMKVRALSGNKGAHEASAHFSSALNESIDYRLSAGGRQDNGYDANQFDIQNDSYTTRLFNLRANYHPNAMDSIDVQLGYSNGVRGSGYSTTWMNTPHDKFVTSSFQQIDWKRALGEGDELSVRYYHIYYDSLNTTVSAAPYAGYLVTDNVTSWRDQLEFQHILNTSANNRVVWGASARVDRAYAPNKFVVADQRLAQNTLFAHDEWRVCAQCVLNIGAMLEGHGSNESYTSPRVAFNYHLNEHHTLRAGVSRAYRDPSMLEENGNYHFVIGGVNLVGLHSFGGIKPETVLSRELGYVGIMPRWGATLDVRAFHDQVGNIIYATTGFVVANLIDATHSGLETTLKLRGDKGQLLLNYSHQTITSKTLSYQETMPRNSVSGLYSMPEIAGWIFSVGYYQNGTQLAIDRPPRDRQLLSRRLDLRLARTFKAFNAKEGEVAFVVQAPQNGAYLDYTQDNQFTRRAYMTVSMAY
ncbi:MAG: TonB-dependent receptor [Sideroxydans sp.]|nr:TonB-dependent receptor [Sideroxydans sp.]